jgi:parallel beta-helix repeat protein
MQFTTPVLDKSLRAKMLGASSLILPAILLIGNVQTVNSYPATPPVDICTNTALLTGPATAPSGAITVPAGDNASVNFSTAGATYYFATGTHTLGTGQYAQISPGAGATFIGAPGAILDGQHSNQYAFSGTNRGVTIKYLTIRNFGAAYSNNNEGVVNHNSGTAWKISYCTVQNCEGAGVFIGDSNEVCYNCLKDNGQYGFSIYKPEGVKHIRLDSNEICGNNTDNWEARQAGCGCTGGGKFWDVNDAIVRGNYVHNNKSVGLWADTDNRNFLIDGNFISDNDAEGIFYEISYNIAIRNNTFQRNCFVKGKARGSDAFPDGAIYISSSSGEAAVSSTYSTSEISGNWFKDNWNGIILFEAPDRYCGSVANTSTGYCPLIDLGISDRRWYNRNIHIFNNLFEMNKAAVGATSANSAFCGRNSIMGDYGTLGQELYKGFVTAVKTVWMQNNKFYNNTYVGEWTFCAFKPSSENNTTWSVWRGAPPSSSVLSTSSASVAGANTLYNAMTYSNPPTYGYNQDSGSTFGATSIDHARMNQNSAAMPALIVTRNQINSKIIIRVDGVGLCRNIIITDIAGGIVADLTKNIHHGEAAWNPGIHQRGVYVVTAKTNDKTFTKKLIL